MCATEIKLVHKSGYVSCNGNGNSNYGCEAGPHIAVHITMSNDALFSLKGWYGTIAPAPDDPTIHSLHSQGWWMKDGYNSASPQLVLDLPKNRNAEKTYCFVKNNDYYIWYSEDYSNTEGGDNHGTTVDDVYVNVYEPPTTATATTTTVTTTTTTTTVTTVREDNNMISNRVDAKADTADVTAMEQRLEAKIEQLTQKLKDQEAAHQEEVRL